MLIRRAGWGIFLLFILGTFCPQSSFAQVNPNTDFTNQMLVDYQALADFSNDQFTKSLGFFTSLGWNTPPGVFDILSGPRVEIGFGAGADLIKVTSVDNLQLKALVASSNLSLPAAVPAPFPVATARVGLFNGMDIGFRLCYLPLINFPDFGFSAHFTGWGLDFRYKILDGLQLPTVSVGASWDTIQGNVSFATSVNQSSVYTDPNNGLTYNNTISGTSTYALDWTTKSFGARLMVGKDLGIIFPYAAVGFQRNSGVITSSLSGSVTETVTGPNPSPTVVGSSQVNVAVVSPGSPVILEPKYVLGFDIGEGFHWSVVGESNGTDIAGSTSFRVQF